MALREVKPLDEKQWGKVQSMMKEGPTDKSINAVQKALERANRLERN